MYKPDFKKLGIVFDLFIVMFYIQLPNFAEGKPGWLKFCDKSDSSFLINAGGCSKGVLLNKPVKISCVCVNGVYFYHPCGYHFKWVLAESPCNPNPFVLVGTGDCFALKDSLISSIKFIGRPSTPFSPGTFIGTEQWTGFWKVSPSTKTGRIIPHMNTTTIISINSVKAVTAKNVACCVPYEMNRNLPVHVCLEAPGGDYLIRSKCQASLKKLHDFHPTSLTYGQGMKIGDTEDETLFLASSKDCSVCAKKHRVTYETDCCKAIPFEDDEDFILTDFKRYEKQTNRMAVAHLDFILRNKKTVKITTAEFTHLRYATHILSRVCPSDEVPKSLLMTVLRFFKQVVNESVLDFPMERTVDELQHQKVLNVLQTCLHSSTSNGSDVGQSMWKVKYVEGSCDTEIDKMVTPNGEINSEIPEFQQHDMYRYDFVTETVWKIIQFVNYFCSRYFEEHPTVGSYLLTGLERLLNPDILRRWVHPGKTYEVLQFLLPTQNLEKFSQVLDACVGTAKSLSVHKQWLIRPSSRRTSKKNKKSTPIWNNDGVCLMSYWYPSERSGDDYCAQ